MNHVWAVTFKSAEGKRKMLATPEIVVKGRRCIVIDPDHQDVRVKLHWLLFGVADDDVKAALAPYGNVLEVTRERWRVDGCMNLGTTTRTAVLRLKGGVTCDNIPHQLRVAGETALVVVPGRAPLCLRCEKKGHIRKDCRAPKCNVCRRVGHDGAHCERTYAAAATPAGSDEISELRMDEADAEDAVKGSTANTLPLAKPESAPGGKSESSGNGEGSAANAERPADQQAASSDAKTVPSPAAVNEGVNKEKESTEPMEDEGLPSAATVKRSRENDGVDQDGTGQGEQPSKTVPARRSRITVKPNVPEDNRRPSKPPP
uniref:Putative l1-5 drl1-5 dr n=1 Tax=Ixodes ricinus TaxID=34613 RepID=A0A147BIW4_IXORI